jgi:hypothetical protein
MHIIFIHSISLYEFEVWKLFNGSYECNNNKVEFILENRIFRCEIIIFSLNWFLNLWKSYELFHFIKILMFINQRIFISNTYIWSLNERLIILKNIHYFQSLLFFEFRKKVSFKGFLEQRTSIKFIDHYLYNHKIP